MSEAESSSAMQPILEKIFPAFEPHRLFQDPLSQTLVPLLWPLAIKVRGERQLRIGLKDGDLLVATVDPSPNWKQGERIAVLVHGLGGSESSQYMIRLSHSFSRQGILPIRLNLRGCGPGFGMAKKPYHAGRSEDLRVALDFISNNFKGSPLTTVGFSLGGNLVLKMLGESVHPEAVDSFISISAPLDLGASCKKMNQLNPIFDQLFVLQLRMDIKKYLNRFPELPRLKLPNKLTLSELDDLFTAPYNGFKSAQEYYDTCSSKHFIDGIKIPGLLIISKDDPIIDVESYNLMNWPKNLSVVSTPAGGHVGFVSRYSQARWWTNHCIEEWLKRTVV